MLFAIRVRSNKATQGCMEMLIFQLEEDSTSFKFFHAEVTLVASKFNNV